jgi:hypothetical protein
LHCDPACPLQQKRTDCRRGVVCLLSRCCNLQYQRIDMYNIATKKRLKLGKTTVRELSDHESAWVGGGANPITTRVPFPPTPPTVTVPPPIKQSLVCTITPSNPPPSGTPPNGGATTGQPSGTPACGTPGGSNGCSGPSVCVCVPETQACTSRPCTNGMCSAQCR